MNKIGRRDVDSLFLDMFFRKSHDITDEEIAYFREHPDQIDEVTAPIYIHSMFLWAGVVVGILLMTLSKVLKFSSILSFALEGVRELAVDLVYEAGAALIGGSVVAYMLGTLLNRQQENAMSWRSSIRARLGQDAPPTDDA